MDNKTSLLAVLVAVLALFLSVVPLLLDGEVKQEQKEIAYERILSTGTIRCSYLIWPPYFSKDPNTGKFSGLYYDIMERIGEDLNLKIDWAEEVGANNAYEGLAYHRVDMACLPATITAARARAMDFTRPVGYSPFYLYVRAGDTRFDDSVMAANNENVRLMSLDGYVAATMTKEIFPKARFTALPNMNTDADVLMSISTGKADGAICDPAAAEAFIENNPGKIKRAGVDPLRYPSTAFAVPIGEERLKAMMNNALTHYIETGILEKLSMKYDLGPDIYLRPAKPYDAP